MINPEKLLDLAENLIHTQTNTYCSDLHRKILLSTLRGERKTYEQFADELGYSCKYIKHDIAPKLWHLLSVSVGQKVTKSNARPILEEQMRWYDRNLVASKLDPSVSSLPTNPKGTGKKPSFPFLEEEFASIDNSSEPFIDRAATLTRASILLIDDEPKNLRLLSDLLEEQGYEVRQAIDASIAIEAINLAAPDLILLDVCMPELDGYTLCQRLKANPETKDIPIIFVTALDEAWNKVKAFSSGAVDYINKPFKVVEVLARIENQLTIKQSQQELLAKNARLERKIQELQRLAAIDSLTQVSSRNRFDEYLVFNWYQSAAAPTYLTLIFAEIDNFDRDRNSTDASVKEQLLFKTAQIIKNIFKRPEDLIARYEDTTFGIILPNLEMETSEAMARNLLARVEKIQIPSISLTCTLSIGMATVFPDLDFQLETFVKNCADLLERAKNEGGNGIVLV